MALCSLLQSSSDMLAMRCRSNEAASISGRTPCMQHSMHRRPLPAVHGQRRPFSSAVLRSSANDHQAATQRQAAQPTQAPQRPAVDSGRMLQASLPLWLLTAAPAIAADADFAQGSASTASYYATLFLFVSTLPGGVQPFAKEED